MLYIAKLEGQSCKLHIVPRYLRKTEELEVLLLERRNRVPDTLREDGLETRAKGGVRVTGWQVRLADVRNGRGGVIEDGCPLLDLLEEVLRVERGVAVIPVSMVRMLANGGRTLCRATLASSGIRR